jgi:ABC-type polar amino acid transport system ATPase subunit
VSTSSPIIEFSKVNKWYGEFHVLRDIDLSVAKGERIVVCGPSGSGKSTLIRCVNRLEVHQAGTLDRGRHRTDATTSNPLKRCAAKWAWCFSSSTCFHT